MRLPLVVGPAAEADLAEASSWYDAQRPGLGDEFIDEIDAAFKDLQDRPFAFAEAHRGCRRMLMRRFPYAVFFAAEADRIVVHAVMHVARDPRRLKERLRSRRRRTGRET